MHRCIVCNTPMSEITPMGQVVTECRNCSNQPCIHGWLENQNQNLCPVCTSVVGGNRFTPIFGSANTINGNRNNEPPADRRNEASGDFTNFIFNLGLLWNSVLLFIIILVILCAMPFII